MTNVTFGLSSSEIGGHLRLLRSLGLWVMGVPDRAHLITFRVRRRRGKMYVGHDLDVSWGNGRVDL